MPGKVRVQCRRIEGQPINMFGRAMVELVSGHPGFEGRMPIVVSTSLVLRIDTVGYYVVEFETHNTIYEVIH